MFCCSLCVLSDNVSDTSSGESTFPGLDILCRPSSLRPTSSFVTGDIANASCCHGNSSPLTSSADSSSSSGDDIEFTNDTSKTSITEKRPKRYYWLQLWPNKCVKVQLDRLDLLAMLDRYAAHCPAIHIMEQSCHFVLNFLNCRLQSSQNHSAFMSP